MIDLASPAPPPRIELKPDCPHCAKPDTGLADTSCHGCCARRIAQSPAAWKAARGLTDVDIRNAIVSTFGQDGYRAGRLAVWQWMQRLGIVKP
ncbi:MAG: hypothetical protein RL456_1944 [Pseudomonadota bacterium]|jgi:hypothetical protein